VSLPAGSTESPLIIDLPDGQKIVVGNIPNGTVIEVATWRGTGRPDSRTNRMMLGVSSAEVASTQEEEDRRDVDRHLQDPAKSNKSKYLGILNFPKRFIFWLIKKEVKPKVNLAKRDGLDSDSLSSPDNNSSNKTSSKLKILNRFAQSIISSRKKRFNQKAKPLDENLSQDSSQWLDSLLGKSDFKPGTEYLPVVEPPTKVLKSKKPITGSKKRPSTSNQSTKRKKK
jgi:hypothetical protein